MYILGLYLAEYFTVYGSMQRNFPLSYADHAVMITHEDLVCTIILLGVLAE
jgi:hypothetical protein